MAVKVYAGTPPIPFEPSDYYKMLKSPELFSVIISEQIAPAILADQLNTAINGLAAAIGGQTDAVSAISGTASIAELTGAAAKFGDRLASICAWVVHSKVMNDIWQNALVNSNTLFRFGDVAVREDQFGRKFIMTDSPPMARATFPLALCGRLRLWSRTTTSLPKWFPPPVMRTSSAPIRPNGVTT